MLIVLNSWGPCDDCDDQDGCPADIDNNCFVGMSDLLSVLGSFDIYLQPEFIIYPADISFDGTVDNSDIQLILDNWGE